MGPGLMKLFHPRGVDVFVPAGLTMEDYANLLSTFDQAITDALAAGWALGSAPLEVGETKESIGFVVRREKENTDKSLTPLIDLYLAEESKKYSVLSVYLNKDEDVAAFEQVSGLRLTDLQVYIGANKIERGKSRQTDKLVFKAARPFGVVHKPNPKYDPDETDTTKKKPARLFVRWDAPQAASPNQTGPRSQATVPEDQERLMTGWIDELKKQPTLAVFNQMLPNISTLDKGRKAQMWDLLLKHAAFRKWVFLNDTKQFVPQPK